MTFPKLACALACALLLLPGSALAAIGRVSLVEGMAHRVPSDTATRSPRADAKTERLEKGTGIELSDRITVEEGAHLKITLNDGSVVVVGGGSTLYIDEARFEGQERRGFGVFLEVGKLWAKVKKAVAGSDAKFEVTTERAVAGVRGTIFRIDALKATLQVNTAPESSKAPRRKAKRRTAQRRVSTRVRVDEGKVAVGDPRVYAQVTASGAAQPDPGPRRQVAGPQEVDAATWEERFVLLQAGRQVVVGPDLWEVGAVKAGTNDAFDDWVNANGG